MSNASRAAKSTIIIIIFSLGSKFLGFIREVLIASKFGSGMETDTFFIAVTATGLLTTMIGLSINTTMIPILSEVEAKEGKQGKIYHTNNTLNIIYAISLLIVVIGWIAAPIIIRILASGFQGEQFDLAVKLMRIGLPVMFFSCTVYVFRGYLQSEMMFAESGASNFPYNFVYIFFLLFFSNRFGIKGLTIASVLAAASQIIIQIPGAKKTGFKYKFIFDIKDEYIRKLFLLVPPVLIGVAINDINKIIDRTLASNLVTGSISALNYAHRLEGLILGVFISAISTVIFPMLSKEASNDNMIAMKKIMGHGINIILVITIPATVGLIVLATPIVQIAFERGAFNSYDTVMTSQALIFYSIGLLAASLRPLLNKVYYSLQDTRTPMLNGGISVVFNIVFNLILMRYMAHSGLALATSLAAIITIILLYAGLKRKIGSLGTKTYIICGAKSGIASAIMGIAAYLIYNRMYWMLEESAVGNIVSLLTSVAVAVLIYLILCYTLGIEEVKLVVDSGQRKLKSAYFRNNKL